MVWTWNVLNEEIIFECEYSEKWFWNVAPISCHYTLALSIHIIFHYGLCILEAHIGHSLYHGFGEKFCFPTYCWLPVRAPFYPRLVMYSVVRRICDSILSFVVCSLCSQQVSEEGNARLHRICRSWNHLSVYSIKQVNCFEVKASKLIQVWNW
jgi:hypothetical protein